MPLYEYRCTVCNAARDVLLKSPDQKKMELICVNCGGVMKVIDISIFSFRSFDPLTSNPKIAVPKMGSCGHGHHCRCSIKSKKASPFQEQIKEALIGNSNG